MHPFELLRIEIERYKQLAYHQDPALSSQLASIQQWQKKRMNRMHSTLFTQAENQRLSSLFLNQLYAGPNFPVLAAQFERLLNHNVSKVAKVVPAGVLNTALLGIQLAVQSIALDEALAKQLLETPIDDTTPDDMMWIAYNACEQIEPRRELLRTLNELGDGLDRYMRSFLVYGAFKLGRGAAERKNFIAMYEFVDESFLAMKPLKSTKNFITQFTTAEMALLNDIASH